MNYCAIPTSSKQDVSNRVPLRQDVVMFSIKAQHHTFVFIVGSEEDIMYFWSGLHSVVQVFEYYSQNGTAGPLCLRVYVASHT